MVVGMGCVTAGYVGGAGGCAFRGVSGLLSLF
jgi:hypothetical protein